MNQLVKKLAIAVLTLGVLSACTSASTTDNSYSKIMENKEIVIGTEGTYAPFSYHDADGTLTGYDVEIAQAVAAELGVKATFVESPWDGLLAGMDANKYDVMFNQVGVTAEREQKYLFSTPYTYSQGVVVVKKDNTSIASVADLNGKKAAQTTTSNWGKTATEAGATIVPTEGFDESVSLVVQGRADATMNDQLSYLHYISVKKDADIKVAATTDDSSKMAALIPAGQSELQTKINEALAKLRADGTIQRISEKYFGQDVSEEIK